MSLHVDSYDYMGPLLANDYIRALQAHTVIYHAAFPRGMLHLYPYMQVSTLGTYTMPQVFCQCCKKWILEYLLRGIYATNPQWHAECKGKAALWSPVPVLPLLAPPLPLLPLIGGCRCSHPLSRACQLGPMTHTAFGPTMVPTDPYQVGAFSPPLPLVSILSHLRQPLTLQLDGQHSITGPAPH
jgi:hypothetical protein